MTNVISRDALLKYIENEQVAFLFGDGLLTFTQTGDDIETKEVKAFVSASSEIKEVFASGIITKDNEYGLNELAKWSQSSDMLILVDKALLLCLPQNNNLQIA